MKKIFFLLSALFAFIVFENFTAARADEGGIQTYDKGCMDIWAVAPTFYEGYKDVVIYSSSHPEGERVYLEEVYIGDNGYSLFLASHSNIIRTSEGSYWAVASTSGDDISLNTVAQCYIDTDPKSIYPNLSDEYNSYTLVAEPEPEIVGYSGDVPIYKGKVDSIYHKYAGIPQIFCLFGDLETVPSTAEEAEQFFTAMLKGYIEKKYNTYSHSYLRSWYPSISASAGQATGHFDDYFYFYRPLGVSMYQYMTETKNDAVQSLTVESSLFSLDDEVKEFVAYAEGLPNSYSDDEVTFEELETLNIKNTWFYMAKDWGWDYYVDTRNLERDEDGYVCEAVRITADSNGKLLFPELGDEIPEDLPGYLGVLDTHPTNPKKPTSVPTQVPAEKQEEVNLEIFPGNEEESLMSPAKEPVNQTLQEGGNFEILSENKEESPISLTKEPINQIPQEEKSSSIVIVIVVVLVLAGVAFLGFKRKSEKKKQ